MVNFLRKYHEKNSADSFPSHIDNSNWARNGQELCSLDKRES